MTDRTSDILNVMEYFLLETSLHPTIDIYSLIGGQTRVGVGPDQADPLVDASINATETCILLRYLSRITKIDVAGYATTKLAGLTWQIECNVISKASGAAADKVAGLVEALLLPDVDVAYDGFTYKIHTEGGISRVSQWDSAANYYREILTIRGRWWFTKE